MVSCCKSGAMKLIGCGKRAWKESEIFGNVVARWGGLLFSAAQIAAKATGGEVPIIN